QQEGGTAVISVKDSGIGIAPGMLSRVFEMFTQVGRSLGQSEGGLGIGLALAKRLVEMHGGSIEAHSEGSGKGSEFIVRLPVKETTRSGPAAAPDLSSSVEQRPAKRRILIADDNKEVVERFETMLQKLGNEVLNAH